LYFQCDVNLITLLIMSFEDIKLRCLLYVHEGGNAVEIKTEADGNDMTECSHDDMSSAGVFHFPDSILSAFIVLPLTKDDIYVFACMPTFVCLSVCVQDYLKTHVWIWLKCCVSTNVGTWMN